MTTPLHPEVTQGPDDGRGIARLIGIGLVLLFGLAVVLWARYGTAVFMDTMASAWAFCF